MDFVQIGDRQAPAIVGIMGLGLPGDFWPPEMIHQLVKLGFQVVLPHNRDATFKLRSSWPEIRQSEVLNSIIQVLIGRKVHRAPYTLEDMALDVVTLLDEIHLQRVHLMGFSMGGMIAQAIAAHHPNRVVSLTSISSATGRVKTGFGKLTAIWGLIHEPKGQVSLEAYFHHSLEMLSGKKYQPTDEEIKFGVNKLPQPFDRQAVYRQLLAILASGDRSTSVAQIQAPTLVIHGTDDPLLPYIAGLETANLIAHSTFWGIDGLGHQLPFALASEMAHRIGMHCHACGD